MRTRATTLSHAIPLLFLFGVFAAGSTYGYFIHSSEVFPYSALKEAKVAYDALRAVSRRKEPSSFLAYVPATVQRPSAARIREFHSRGLGPFGFFKFRRLRIHGRKVLTF